MRLFTGFLTAAFLTGAASHAADLSVPEPPRQEFDPRRWEFSLNTEARLNSWRGDRGYPTLIPTRGRGHQFYLPVSLQASGRPNDDFRIELQGRGGVVRSVQETRGASGEMTTLTDSSAAATVTYYGFNGWQPFASLAVNAPTGRSAAFGKSAYARMDADLVDIPIFGEGWNIGPTAGVNIAIDETSLLTLSGGATFRGDYDREPAAASAALRQTLAPADVFTATASYIGQFGPLTVTALSSYATETATAVDRVKLLESGDRFTLTANGLYQWSENWRSALGLAWLHTMKNKVLDPTVSALVREAFNSNSNVYRASFEHVYTAGAWSLGPTGSVLHRDRNSWNPTALQFSPAKTRWSAGLTGSYQLSESVNLNARVEHIWTHEKANPDKVVLNTLIPGSGVIPVSQHGVAAALGSTIKF